MEQNPAGGGETVKKSAYRDVTREYLENATPNSHAVQDSLAYTVNGATYQVDGKNVQLKYSQHEKEIAELLERTLGGELYMVPKVNIPQGIQTPDYLFRGEAHDLKTIHEGAGSNTIFNRVKSSLGQARRFIIDVTKSGLNDETINLQIEKLFSRDDTSLLEDVFVVRNGEITRIVKRKN